MNLQKIIFILAAIFSLFGIQAFAGDEMLPTSEHEVTASEQSAQQKTIDGKTYVRTSSVFEYQYDNVQVDSANGKRSTLRLDLDDTALSFAIVIYTENRNFGYVQELTDPNNNALISAQPAGVDENLFKAPRRGQYFSPNAALFEVYKQMSVTPVPNSDAVKVIPGAWKFSIAVEDLKPEQSDKFKVSVFVKKGKKVTEKTRGQVNVNLFSTAESQLGQTKEQVERLLIASTKFMQKQGIDLNFNSYSQLDSKDNEACSSQQFPCYAKFIEINNRVQSQKTNPGDVNVYFLKKNMYADSGIATYSGSVASLFGHSKDMFGGVFVWRDPFAGVDNYARTFVHELGHHLGLYHTNVDAISDTQDQQHWAFGDQQPKDRNLMNVGGGDFVLSAGQKYVLINALAVTLYEPL